MAAATLKAPTTPAVGYGMVKAKPRTAGAAPRRLLAFDVAEAMKRASAGKSVGKSSR